MDEGDWWPIQCREFWDMPRSIVVDAGDRIYLLESRFDEELDEYTPHFRVYRLREMPAEESWLRLAEAGEPLGTVLVADVEFDATRRRAVRPGFLNHLSK